MKIISVMSYVICGMAIAFSACHKTDVHPPALRNFKQFNLVANKSVYNPVTIDPTLINGFGMAWSPSGVAWVNSVGGHVSEVYNADGTVARSAVTIPSPADDVNGLPTGIVFSGGKGFQIPGGTASFVFSGFDGVISGWNPAANSTAKRLKAPPQAAFSGLAIASVDKSNFVYAANFAANRIDVWDTTFSRVSMDFKDPSVPAGFSPYNIQEIGNQLFVLYAQVGNNGLPVAGSGKGFVSIFSADGKFIRRFASEATLNIPWGITAAKAGFLQHEDLTAATTDETMKLQYNGSHDEDVNEQLILIGNFGDGRINVFSNEGRFLGQLQSKNKPIEIDGLWALSFAPPTAGIDPQRLYFTAGPNHETDGLFGYLIKQ